VPQTPKKNPWNRGVGSRISQIDAGTLRLRELALQDAKNTRIPPLLTPLQLPLFAPDKEKPGVASR